uniref:Uncharacterized protein n=1 Tax=Palpitomonas bilix TaxID=652834 RepID=A0A7S3GLB9_9EUKA|mmetsp:Transcript_8387/g.22407  ORF Transcript_8387/g.22407 Transcript_8387/m.22407 type:complete len:842 (+) Transcript_8387:378-2903(+)
MAGEDFDCDPSYLDMSGVCEAPTFRPTVEQFSDPEAYIESVSKECEPYGILKIVVPEELRPTVDVGKANKFNVRIQRIQPVQSQKTREKGVGGGTEDSVTSVFGFINTGRKYSIQEHRQKVTAAGRKELEGHQMMKPEEVEQHFLKRLHGSGGRYSAYYANDVVGDVAKRDSKWTLQDLPSGKRCPLRHLEDLPGVTSPMLYIGCLYGMFCWHVEDNWLSAASYNYTGAPKIWYGVPGAAAQDFLRVATTKIPCLFDSLKVCPDLLTKKVVMFSPAILAQHGVPVFRAVHRPGELMVTTPRAYHAGLSCGWNISASVNFCLPQWLPHGTMSVAWYRMAKKVPVVPMELLLCRMATDTMVDKDVKQLVSRELQAATKSEVGCMGSLSQDQIDRAVFVKVEGENLDDRKFCAACLHDSSLVTYVCPDCLGRGALASFCAKHKRNVCPTCMQALRLYIADFLKPLIKVDYVPTTDDIAKAVNGYVGISTEIRELPTEHDRDEAEPKLSPPRRSPPRRVFTFLTIKVSKLMRLPGRGIPLLTDFSRSKGCSILIVLPHEDGSAPSYLVVDSATVGGTWPIALKKARATALLRFSGSLQQQQTLLDDFADMWRSLIAPTTAADAVRMQDPPFVVHSGYMSALDVGKIELENQLGEGVVRVVNVPEVRGAKTKRKRIDAGLSLVFGEWNVITSAKVASIYDECERKLLQNEEREERASYLKTMKLEESDLSPREFTVNIPSSVFEPLPTSLSQWMSALTKALAADLRAHVRDKLMLYPVMKWKEYGGTVAITMVVVGGQASAGLTSNALRRGLKQLQDSLTTPPISVKYEDESAKWRDEAVVPAHLR